MLKQFAPYRKKKLQKQIFEARKIGAHQHILFLESQWVHRYGIESLKESYFEEVELNPSIDSEELDAKGEIEVDEIMGQQDLFPEHFQDDLTLDNNQNELEIDDNTVDSSLEKDVDKLSDLQEIERSAIERSYSIDSPPPTPALKHLRRWLPNIDNTMPKAS